MINAKKMLTIGEKREEAAKAKERILQDSKMLDLSAISKTITNDPVIENARDALHAGRVIEAVKLLKDVDDPIRLEQFELTEYVELFRRTAKQGQLEAASIVLDKSLIGHPSESNKRRLKYATLLLRFKDYTKCQSILAKVKRNSLSPELSKRYRKLVIDLREARASE